MEIQEYANKMRKIYSLFLEYIDCTVDEKEENLRVFLDMLNSQNTFDDLDEIYEILVLISNVSKTHYRDQDFFAKIEKLLDFFTERIKQSFTNFQIFNIFKSNKRILLFLFEHKIIEIDQSILDFILNSKKEKYQSYKFYFFNEIKEKISTEMKKYLEDELIAYDPNVFNNFHEKCLIGENEAYICLLIRNDSVKEFIIYINQNNITLSNCIRKSIFETNSLLIGGKEPTLIEYSSFFGSIQIFQFLLLNNVNLNSSLWKYSIHGRNPEIIHLLEDNHVEVNYLNISFKCHHNELVHYFEDNYYYRIEYYGEATECQRNTSLISAIKDLFKFKKNDTIDREKIFKNRIFINGFHYHNGEFMPDNFNNKLFFKYFCAFNYPKLVKLFLKYKIVDVNYELINASI